MKYRNYTDEDILIGVINSTSIAGLLRYLKLKPAGGNYINMKRNLQRLNADTEHWTGMGWRKDLQQKDWKDYTRAVRLKPHLIKLRGHACELCQLPEWNGEYIPLEIHHEDGDRTNNILDNLILLCPNCHAQTDNWRNRKR